MTRFFIDAELAAFLERGNSVVVATRNAALEPHATRASAMRVTGPERVIVVLSELTSAQTLADLRENGAIALCVSSVVDGRTVQLKGRTLGICEATADDRLAVERQMQEFAQDARAHGLTRQQIRNLWAFESCRQVEIEVTSAFGQTSEPSADPPMTSKS